jgi:hypothetical protein
MNAAYAHCDVAIAAQSSSVRAAGHPNWLIATTVLASTVLLGGVLGTSGPALVGGFHAAAIACAIESIAASASAFLLIPANERGKMNHGSEV